jgi:phosphoglucosamine mutase
LQEAERRLDGKGRLLVRYSGTEPLLRLMAEGEDQGEIQQIIDELASTLESCLS